MPVKDPSLPNLEHSYSGERPLAFFTCATLSQKGGLEVISALLSFRAPWQHSHQDINMHTQKIRSRHVCTHTHKPTGKSISRHGADMASKAKDFWKFCEEEDNKGDFFFILLSRYSLFFFLGYKKVTLENWKLHSCPACHQQASHKLGPATVSGLHCVKYNLNEEDLILTEVRLTKDQLNTSTQYYTK